jgi:Rps23 Pro-64 3,4-dihydroxylase Tpa1-like proline 4-hydroxylase
MIENIKVFRDFLTPFEQDKIELKILEPKWGCDHFSSPNQNGNLFWQMSGLENDEFFSDHMIKRIQELTGDKFEVERIYFNGHNACSHGSIHTDSAKENGRTFLIYCNRIWHPEYDGGTTFVHNEEVNTFFPYPRSAIYFQNNIKHFANSVGKDFHGVRVTLAFKLYKI